MSDSAQSGKRDLESLRRRLLPAWQALNLGVISLNSFIMLIRSPLAGGMNHVVCAAAAGYVVSLTVQALRLRRRPNRMRIMM